MRRLFRHPMAHRAMRGASLVVTDRRWAAPLSALALGFGLFVGVAIGPGAAGSFATGAQQIIELPGLGDSAEAGVEEAAAPGETAPPASPEESDGLEPALPSAAPLATEPSDSLLPPQSPPATRPPAPETEEHEEETQTLAGTVVHVNPAAGSYALALERGELVSVHAARLPAAGARLSVPLRRLANGTFAEKGARKQTGSSAKAAFRGTVTFLDDDAAEPAYTVSGRGASILVRVTHDPSGGAPQLPALGSYAAVTASIQKPPSLPAQPATEAPVAPEGAPTAGCVPDPEDPPATGAPTAVLWQRRIDLEGEPSTYIDLAGTVTAVCPQTDQLLFSSDDTRESGQDLTLAVGERIDAAKLTIGGSYLATAAVGPDGSLTLAGIAGDERTKGADDAASAQGDLKR